MTALAASFLRSLSLLLAYVMGMISPIWAGRFATTVWIVLVRRRGCGWWLVGLSSAIGGTLLLLLHAFTHAWSPATAAVLTVWITPFAAVPALNALAEARSGDDAPSPVPAKDGALGWRTYVFDARRAELRAAYEPPPSAEES